MHAKTCPECGAQYYELSLYCRKCGVKLEKTANRCSGNKSALCSKTAFSDEDVYCDKCGSLTTYALERQSKAAQ